MWLAVPHIFLMIQAFHKYRQSLRKTNAEDDQREYLGLDVIKIRMSNMFTGLFNYFKTNQNSRAKFG